MQPAFPKAAFTLPSKTSHLKLISSIKELNLQQTNALQQIYSGAIISPSSKSTQQQSIPQKSQPSQQFIPALKKSNTLTNFNNIPNTSSVFNNVKRHSKANVSIGTFESIQVNSKRIIQLNRRSIDLNLQQRQDSPTVKLNEQCNMEAQAKTESEFNLQEKIMLPMSEVPLKKNSQLNLRRLNSLVKYESPTSNVFYDYQQQPSQNIGISNHKTVNFSPNKIQKPKTAHFNFGQTSNSTVSSPQYSNTISQQSPIHSAKNDQNSPFQSRPASIKRILKNSNLNENQGIHISLPQKSELISRIGSQIKSPSSTTFFFPNQIQKKQPNINIPQQLSLKPQIVQDEQSQLDQLKQGVRPNEEYQKVQKLTPQTNDIIFEMLRQQMAITKLSISLIQKIDLQSTGYQSNQQFKEEIENILQKNFEFEHQFPNVNELIETKINYSSQKENIEQENQQPIKIQYQIPQLNRIAKRIPDFENLTSQSNISLISTINTHPIATIHAIASSNTIISYNNDLIEEGSITQPTNTLPHSLQNPQLKKQLDDIKSRVFNLLKNQQQLKFNPIQVS